MFIQRHPRRLLTPSSLPIVLSQISLYPNRPPSNGTATCSPLTGLSLTTNFTIAAKWWTDADGDLPLSYTYSTDRVLLALSTQSAKLKVRTCHVGSLSSFVKRLLKSAWCCATCAHHRRTCRRETA